MDAAYGAVCDGVSDDSAAFTAAFEVLGTSAGNALFVPPTLRGCRVNSLIYNAYARGPVMIYGAGPKSKIIATDTKGGLTVVGSCGLTFERVLIRDLTFEAGAASAHALKLDGIAAFSILNVDIVRHGGNLFDKGIVLSGAQQGTIIGGASFGNRDGIYSQDCNINGRIASSNGTSVMGRTFADIGTAINLQGGQGDFWIRDAHITTSAKAIVVNQTSSLGGYGPIYASNIHTEANSVGGIEVVVGTLYVDGLNDYNVGVETIKVHPKGVFYLNGGIVNGNVTLDAGSRNTIYNVAAMHGKFSADPGAVVFQFNNAGRGKPSAPASFESPATIPARKATLRTVRVPTGGTDCTLIFSDGRLTGGTC
jgi:hypothetical protein